MNRILALAAAGALFSLPALAAACAIACDSVACHASAASCPGHDGGDKTGGRPTSSGHCPGSRAAHVAFSSFSPPAGTPGLAVPVTAFGVVAAPAPPLFRVAALAPAHHSFRGRSAPIPLRV